MDLEDLKKLDASEIFPRRINAKEVLITQEENNFKFMVADGAAAVSGGDLEFREPTPKREQTERSDVFSEKLLLDSQPDEVGSLAGCVWPPKGISMKYARIEIPSQDCNTKTWT